MDRGIENLRTYAKRYLELATSPEIERRRTLWRGHNSLRFSQPAIYVRAVPYGEFFDMSLIRCEDPLLRRIEYSLATQVEFHSRLNDDFIYEPWVTVSAVTEPMDTRWGVPCILGERPVAGGSAAFHPVLIEEEDIERAAARPHCVDEAATAARVAPLLEAIGDILPVYVDRRGALCRMWNMDISTDLAKLRGLEQIMYDAYDRPEWLHALVSKMQRVILKNIDETEAAGHFTLADHQNQAMPYAEELRDPAGTGESVPSKALWAFMASQETTTFGPALFEEFMLSYQMPIMERFGLIGYGCCEDLTLKIPLLRKVPNLRRIAVSPFANVKKCAEQIGGDYILSYRPNPSSIADGLDEDDVRRTLRGDFDVLYRNGCKFDITLKDVETIAGKPENMMRWVRIVREEMDRTSGG